MSLGHSRLNLKSVRDYSFVFVFIAASFPYLFPVGIYSDLQPWAFAAALGLFFTLILMSVFKNNLKTRKNDVLIFLYALVPLVYFVMVSIYFGMGIPRALFSWVSFFLFTWFGIRCPKEIPSKIIPWVLTIWAIVGSVQLFGSRQFLEFMVLRMHSSHDRGVTSLSVEPSLYACHIFLLYSTYFLTKSRVKVGSIKDLFVALISLIQLVFLAQSFSSLFFGSALFLCMIWETLRHRIVRGAILAVLLIFVIQRPQVSVQGRLGVMLETISRDPSSLIVNDESGRERAANILYPVKIFWGELPWSFGFSPLEEVIGGLRLKYQDRENFGSHFVSSRIESGLGTMIFQLGMVGVIWLLVFSGFIMFQSDLRNVLYGFGFLLLMWTSIPWATPLVGVVSGILIRNSRFGFRKPINSGQV